MYEQPKWGTVNLGVDVLQGHGEQSQPGKAQYQREHQYSDYKEQYNPGRNQELNLPPDLFRMHKNSEENTYSPTGKITKPGRHQRIKELIGEGVNRREAIIRARQEELNEDGPIDKKDIYRAKYNASQPQKNVSVYNRANAPMGQESPYI